MIYRVSVDIESWSDVDLRAHGPRRYFASPNARLLMLAWHVIGDPAPPSLWLAGQPVPPELFWHAANGSIFCGWNVVGFDRIGWSAVGVPRHGFPFIPDENWEDSMFVAAAANLPRGLEGAAQAVGASVQKDRDGHSLMMKLCLPKRTPDPSKIAYHDLQRLGKYCCDDVSAEESTLVRLPAWPNDGCWSRMPGVDRRINDRGILMDIGLVRGMRNAAEAETVRLDGEMAALTNGQVGSTTVVAQLKTWLLAQGVQLPLKDEPKPIEDELNDPDEEPERDHSAYRLRKNDMIDLLAGDLPGDYRDGDRLLGPVRQAIEMRQEAAKASTKKLKAMENVVGPDGRLRGSFNLMGAQQTGRWSGAVWQPHNFPRQPIKGDLYGAIVAGSSGDVDLIRGLYGPVMPWVSRMLRRTLSAPHGYTLLQGDFAQVEARIIAWLAGQTNITEAFRNKQDVYKIAAMPIVGKPINALTEEERQIGKIAVLGLGFAGGPGVFVVMGMNYGIRMIKDQAKPIVLAWREANAEIVKFWYATYDAMVNAVRYEGREFAVAPLGVLSYFMHGGALCCRLPSKRLLRYWAPQLGDPDWTGRPTMTVLSIKGKAAIRRKMWPGLAVENPVQAIGADLLCTVLDNLDRHGELPVVLHVHDSAACEVKERDAERLLPDFKAAMLDMPDWAAGLPMGVDVKISPRFG